MSTSGVEKSSEETFIENVVNAALTNDVGLLQSTIGDDKSKLANITFNGLNALHFVGKSGNEAACFFMAYQYPDKAGQLIYGAAYGGHEACTLNLVKNLPGGSKLNFYTATSGAQSNNHLDFLTKLLKIADQGELYKDCVGKAIYEKNYNQATTLLQAAGSHADYNSAALNAVGKNDLFCLDMLRRAEKLADYQQVATKALEFKRETLAQAIVELAQENGRKLDYNALAHTAAIWGLKITLELLKLAGKEADYYGVSNKAFHANAAQLRSEIIKQRDALSKPKETFMPMYDASVSSTSTNANDELTQLRNSLAAALARIDALETTVNDLKVKNSF